MMDSKILSVRLEKSVAKVSLDTLLQVQSCFLILSKEANSNYFQDSEVSINVVAYKDGCFEVMFEFISDYLPHALALAPIADVGQVVELIVNFFKLKKFLKGSKPEKTEITENEENVTLHDCDNASIVVNRNTYNFYSSNIVANEVVEKTFRRLGEDSEIEAVAIGPDHTPLFEADRAEFKGLSASNEILKDEMREEIVDNAVITLSKINFERGYANTFYWNGRKITVYIRDEDFYKRIDKGFRVGKGDTFLSRMKIKKKYDQDLRIFIDDNYEVEKVHKVAQRPEQASFTFNVE